MTPDLARALRASAPLVAALALLGGCKERKAEAPAPAPAAQAPVPVSAAELQAFGVDRGPGEPAPPLELTTMDGAKVSLASLKGQVVFVNFWATWCPPCVDEMPTMLALGRELSARYPGKFTMLAVSVDDGWDPVREFFGAPPYLGKTAGMTVALDSAEHAATVAFYCAARGGCPEAFKFPETYIVDRAGRLVAYVVGPRNWATPTARAFLEQLIRL